MEKSIISEHNSIKNSKMSSYQKGRHLWRKEQRSPLLTASCLQWTSFNYLEEPHCCCCIFLTAMVLGFCHKSNRKLAWDSPTTTPTPYHILSPGKERKREDKGNEEVQARETTRRTERAQTGKWFPKKTVRAVALRPSAKSWVGTDDTMLLGLSQ